LTKGFFLTNYSSFMKIEMVQRKPFILIKSERRQ